MWPRRYQGDMQAALPIGNCHKQGTTVAVFAFVTVPGVTNFKLSFPPASVLNVGPGE
ncbi:hypothetical protein H0H93_013836 [Arthromyces matolae]|nr:hypothetical protein H0H93_013836 [Arthromyces matolae]